MFLVPLLNAMFDYKIAMLPEYFLSTEIPKKKEKGNQIYFFSMKD